MNVLMTAVSKLGRALDAAGKACHRDIPINKHRSMLERYCCRCCHLVNGMTKLSGTMNISRKVGE